MDRRRWPRRSTTWSSGARARSTCRRSRRRRPSPRRRQRRRRPRRRQRRQRRRRQRRRRRSRRRQTGARRWRRLRRRGSPRWPSWWRRREATRRQRARRRWRRRRPSQVRGRQLRGGFACAQGWARRSGRVCQRGEATWWCCACCAARRPRRVSGRRLAHRGRLHQAVCGLGLNGGGSDGGGWGACRRALSPREAECARFLNTIFSPLSLEAQRSVAVPTYRVLSRCKRSYVQRAQRG